MKISKIALAVWGAFCHLANQPKGHFGIGPGVLRTGANSLGNVPAEVPIESFISGTCLNITAARTLTEADSGRAFRFNQAAGFAVTLPRASGSGMKFKFYIGVTITSIGAIIKVGNTDDSMRGIVISGLVGTPTTVNVWPATAASAFDTITLNGTTTGGIIGDWIEVEDVAPGIWQVSGVIQQSGAAATVFTATV